MDIDYEYYGDRRRGRVPKIMIWYLPASNNAPELHELSNDMGNVLTEADMHNLGKDRLLVRTDCPEPRDQTFDELEVYDIWRESNPFNGTEYLVTTLLFEETGKSNCRPQNRTLEDLCGVYAFGDCYVYMVKIDKDTADSPDTNLFDPRNVLVSMTDNTTASLRYKLNYFFDIKEKYERRVYGSSSTRRSLAPVYTPPEILIRNGVYGRIELDPLWQTQKTRTLADAQGSVYLNPGTDPYAFDIIMQNIYQEIYRFNTEMRRDISGYLQAYIQTYNDTVRGRASGSVRGGRPGRKKKGRGVKKTAQAWYDEKPASPSEGRVTCYICFDEFEPSKMTVWGPCGHRFCDSCASNWKKNTRNIQLEPTCPFCRGASFGQRTRS